jgi:hypothetical protein
MEENTTPKRTYQKHKIIGKITIKHFAKLAKYADDETYELYIEIIAKKQNTKFRSHILIKDTSIEELMENSEYEREEEKKVLEYIIDGLNVFERDDFKISEINDIFQWLNRPVSALTEELLKSEIQEELITNNEYHGIGKIMFAPQISSLSKSSLLLYYKYLDTGYKSLMTEKYKSNIWVLKSFEDILEFNLTQKAIEIKIEDDYNYLFEMKSLHSFMKGHYKKFMLEFHIHPTMEDTFLDILRLIENNNSNIYRLFEYYKIIR